MSNQKVFSGRTIMIALVLGLVVIGTGAYFITHRGVTLQTVTTWTSLSSLPAAAHISLPVGVDPATFVVESGSGDFAKDKNSVYVLSGGMGGTYEYESVPGFDLSTFSIFSTASGNPTIYAKDKNGVYAYSLLSDSTTGIASLRMQGVDPATFTVLTDASTAPTVYAKDENHVFFSGHPIANADPATFSVSRNAMPETVLNISYAKDGHSIYCDDKPLANVNLTTYSLMSFMDGSPSDYAKDNQHVWYRCKLIPGADVASFTLVNVTHDGENGEAYSKDKNHVYYDSPSTALEIAGPGGIDPTAGAWIIGGADPTTFVGLPDRTAVGVGVIAEAKDKNYFYFVGRPVQTASGLNQSTTTH